MDALERAIRGVLEDPDVKANVYRNGRFFSPRGKCRPLLRERLEKLRGTAAEDTFPKAKAIYEKLKELNSAEFRGRLYNKGLRDDAAELREAGRLKRKRRPGLYVTCPTCGSRRKLKSSRRLNLSAGAPAASSSTRLCGDDETMHYPEEDFGEVDAPAGAEELADGAVAAEGDGAVDMQADAASAETSDTETREMEAEIHEMAMALQELAGVVLQRRATLEAQGAGSEVARTMEEIPAAHAAASSAATELLPAAPLPTSAEAETQLYNAPGQADDSAPEGAAAVEGAAAERPATASAEALANRMAGQARYQQFMRDKIGEYMEHYVPNAAATELARACWCLESVNRSRGSDRKAFLKHLAAARELLQLPALTEAAPRNSRGGSAFTAWGHPQLQSVLTSSASGA